MPGGRFLRHRRSGTARATRNPSAAGLTVAPGLVATSTGETTASRDVIAASATVVGRAQIRRSLSGASWQAELWDFYDTTGELRFATRWLANAVSRCSLFIGRPGDNGEPVPDTSDTSDAKTAQALLESLHYGQIGQAEMLRRIALHLSIPGETHLVGMDADGGHGRRWYVASSDEIAVNSQGAARLTLPETGQSIDLDPDSSTIIRIWSPHPRRGWEADSAVRATLPVLREIKGLSDHIAATVDSRLAGAGLLTIPHSATIPNPSQSDPGGSAPLHEDPFTDALTQAMLTPIADRDDASAVVPVVIKVPDEAAAGIKHITTATELSEKVAEMRKAALERFAAGADLPQEFVTGTGSINHWGLAQLEDSAVKLYVEPLAGVICDALTQQYLWPALRASGVDDPEQWMVWYNSAELTQRPNKAAEAQALWDKGLLSNDAVRRESGFEPEDAPTPDEHQRWVTERITLSHPGLAHATTPQALDGRQPVPDETPNPAPAALPASADPAAAWWLSAVEQVVLRAMELAGKRLLGSLPRAQRHRDAEPRRVPTWEIHTVVDPISPDQLSRLLDGAYDTATVNFDGDTCVLSAVGAYCRHLLSTGTPHTREGLATWLARNECTPQAPAA